MFLTCFVFSLLHYNPYFDALIVSYGKLAFRVCSSNEIKFSKSGTNRIELEHVFKPPERIIRT